MYSPEGQNKTIPLFLQEKQGELLFFNFIFRTINRIILQILFICK